MTDTPPLLERPAAAARGLIPAATILLLRDSPAGIEVFFVQRHHQIEFAAGALVFPGGKLDPRDHDPRLDGRLDGAAGLPPLVRALRVAAIREAFEEGSVLLARPRGGGALAPERLERIAARWRHPLARGEIGIAEVVVGEDLVLGLDQLVLFAHWITPSLMPKRFDTFFYLAVAPADQVGRHDGHETVDTVWLTARQALADQAAGQRQIVFPTRMNLRKLSRWPRAADALAAARVSPVVTVEPQPETRDGEAYLVLPAAAGYDLDAVAVRDIL